MCLGAAVETAREHLRESLVDERGTENTDTEKGVGHLYVKLIDWNFHRIYGRYTVYECTNRTDSF